MSRDSNTPSQDAPGSRIADDPWIVAQITQPARVDFPADRRPLGNRTVVPIADRENSVVLRWDESAAVDGAAILRFTVGVDDRAFRRVVVEDASTGDCQGVVELPFASVGQPYELELGEENVRLALRHGVRLVLESAGPPLWIVGEGPLAPPSVQPHLLPVPDGEPDRLAEFLRLVCSPASLQPSDWMGVCVLDGLRDLAQAGCGSAEAALAEHLSVFFTDAGDWRREDFRGRPCDNAPGGPESTGPLAVLALRDPCHPALRFAEQAFEKHYSAKVDAVGRNVVAETSYNIAYPMMAMGVMQSRPELKLRALHQLEVNRTWLVHGDDLWLRYLPESATRTFPNWSRGVAWYALGLVRSLALLPANERPEPHLVEVRRLAKWVARHQRTDGLWSCFFKETEIPRDTSGCSGIAAALALAVRHGMLGAEYSDPARRAFTALQNHLAPDGWLRGVSQSNKAEAEAIDLQRGPFRVIGPWGMGLLAQLFAALGLPPALR